MRFLVTGASSYIGRATVLALLEKGHEVIASASSEDSLQKVKEECKNCEYLVFDFKNTTSIDSLFHKPIDGLILNACSKVGRLKRFADLNLEDSFSFIESNMRGNLFLIHRVIKEQMKHGIGRNVFVSSVSVAMGTSRYGAYCFLKSGMEGLFRNLAVDYGHKNIFFNSIRPGIIATSRHEDVRNRKGYNELMTQKIPSSTLGSPEQVAKSILLLVEQDSYINGTHLEVSGGLPMFRTDLAS